MRIWHALYAYAHVLSSSFPGPFDTFLHPMRFYLAEAVTENLLSDHIFYMNIIYINFLMNCPLH